MMTAVLVGAKGLSSAEPRFELAASPRGIRRVRVLTPGSGSCLPAGHAGDVVVGAHGNQCPAGRAGADAAIEFNVSTTFGAS